MQAKMYKRMDDEQEHDDNNDERLDEPWEESQENLIKSWRTTCEGLAERHEQAAKAAKKKGVTYGLPAIIIPLVMTPLSSAFQDNAWIGFIEMTAFMTTGLASATSQFFNFSGKSEKHFAFSARYADLVTDIDQELAKRRPFRQSVDTFSLKIKMAYMALNRAAPDL
jgi:hypothetical protein